MSRFALTAFAGLLLAVPLSAQDAAAFAGKKVVFLGDCNTPAGGYVMFTTNYLEKLHPE